jgi:hypothetical protein
MKSYEYLNGKSSYKSFTDSLKIIQLYKIVQVHRQNLKSKDEMLPKHKTFYYFYYVFLVFWIPSF